MNKKITAVTLTALMVLTMFTAMVPSASAAAIVDEVSAPYEFIGAVEEYVSDEAIFDLTSATNPSILYFDFDEGDGEETLYFEIENTTKLQSYTFNYTTAIYEGDADSQWDKIAWLGQPYAVVDNESDMFISKLLFDEDPSEDHLLRVGETFTLPDGFSITAQEIDVDGKEAWFFVNKDGEELYSTVTAEGDTFVYKEDLNNSNEKENPVLAFNVEVVFAGMNTNMVKINNTQLISLDVLEIENGDEDTIDDFEITVLEDGSLLVRPDDRGSDDTISLSKGGTVDIMDRFNIRINDDGTYVGISVILTEPGLYEMFAEVKEYVDDEAFFALTSELHPSVLYFDFDEGEGEETLYFEIENTTKLQSNTFNYTTAIYPGDADSQWDKIAWLGQPYAVVDNESDMFISKLLFDEDPSEDHLLRVGETFTLPDGFSITAQEIDVDGKEAWFFVNKDGEELYSTVTAEGDTYVYKEDLNNSNEKENPVLAFNVEVVFAGMNTNMVKINNTQLISLDVLEIENGDEDTIDDFEITVQEDGSLLVRPNDRGSDDTISLSKGGTVDIMDRFNIRINDDGEHVAVIKVVKVGDGPAPTATTTAVGTEEATEPPTNVTVDGTGVPTEGPTDAIETEVPTEVPTDVVGFEAVFAIAGLLAVAYLVMRQRE